MTVVPVVARCICLMALLSFVVGPVSANPTDDCIEVVDFVGLLQPRQFTVDEPTWLRAHANNRHVYRLGFSGPQGASLELWTTHDDDFTPCEYAVDQLAVREVGPETASLEWTSSTSEAILLTPVGDGVTQTFSLYLEELAAPPEGSVFVIPAVAHSPGAQGTFFQTDLRILNASNRDKEIDLVLVATGGGPEQVARVEIDAGEVAAFDDVVESVFGLENVVGALRVEDPMRYDELTVVSRTYNVAETGTYGQFIPARDWNEAAGAGHAVYGGSTRTLLHLQKSADFRSNLGCVEVLGLEAEIALELFDAAGSSLGRRTMRLPGHAHRQINDVFGFFGAPPREAAMVVAEVLNHARVAFYASVIDNVSSDPIYIPGNTGRDAHRDLVIPAAANGLGKNGTEWRTDLWILAAEHQEPVDVIFVPSGGSSQLSGRFDFAASSLLVIEDVVGQLGGSGMGSGALILRCDEQIVATSRTYNFTDEGTFGQFIPARPLDYGSGRSSVTGVESSEDFRTNVGLFNPSFYDSQEARIRLVSGDGVLLGSGIFHLEANGHTQVNDVFAALNVAPQANCRVDFDVDFRSYRANPGEVHGYASVVDNRTGDPIFVPAEDASGLPEPELELDGWANMVLVDDIHAASGIEDLPTGTFEATVSGSGDLGDPQDPIHALCLFTNPAGDVQAAALAVGESVSGIAGGHPFWCVIPDWDSVADNRGGVSLSLVGGGQQLQLDLDARSNAVRLDALNEAVVSVHPPSETYQVEIENPGPASPLVVMFRDADTGLLSLRTPVAGELVESIDTTSQLLVVMADLFDREDIPGVTALRPACTTREVVCGGSVSGVISPSDCDPRPLASHPAERVAFEGIAGENVTITATFDHDFTSIALANPDGNPIGGHYDRLGPGHFQYADLSLNKTGTYSVYVVGSTSSGLENTGYTVELVCHGP